MYHAAKRHFGSWDAALEAAGLKVERIWQRRKWDSQKVVQAIRNWKGPKQSHLVHRKDPGLTAQVYKYFGSWDRALRAAGV